MGMVVGMGMGRGMGMGMGMGMHITRVVAPSRGRALA